MSRKADVILGLIFAASTAAFLVVFFTNDLFFSWAFQKHHNVLSWYIRPVFILPVVLFAFKKSWAGVFASVFALFTSMFWFSAPVTVHPDVAAFLAYEMNYLKGGWGAEKVLFSLTVPVFFILLTGAAWQRSWKWLIGIVVGAAGLKTAWSIAFSGAAGLSILKPALAGFFFFKKRKPARK